METQSKLFSPFLPLQLLVLIVGVWIIYQVYALNQDRLEAEARIQQVIPQADAALSAKKKLLALAQEVAQLSPTDANAAQIMKDFDIRTQSPGKAPASATK